MDAAAVGLTLPYERALNLAFAPVRGLRMEEPWAITDVVYVTRDYLETLRIPVRRGRSFQTLDVDGAQPVIVVNQAFVDQYLGDVDPIGVQLGLSNGTREIVGVVGNVQQRSAWGGFGPLHPAPTIYLPATQADADFLAVVHTWFTPKWVIRTMGPPRSIVAEVQSVLQSVDTQLPVVSVQPMSEIQRASLDTPRTQALLLSMLAALALTLAAVGIYGLVASRVVERTREFGIRLALGATISQVVRDATLSGVALALAGLGSGTILAWWITGSMVERLIWGIEPTDPVAFSTIWLVLLASATIASLLPALRIVQLDPIETLRSE